MIRSDGTPERDYLYVEDAVDAYLAIAGSLDAPRLYGRAWNAGWGAPLPVREMVERLIAVSGVDWSPTSRATGRRTARSTASTSTRPRCGRSSAGRRSTQLDEGLAATWEWYERRLSAARGQGAA